MRIAFIGDWHSNLVWARSAIRHAADQGAETIIHLGDYGYDFSSAWRDGIQGALRRTNLMLQFVDGNHENFTWLNARPIGEDGRRQISRNVHHLPRGYRWEVDGVRFLALGGAFSVDRKRRVLDQSWWLGETITDEDVARAIEGGPVDVLISHDCPSGILIPGIERNAHLFPGDALIQAQNHRERLREVVNEVKPRFIFHGHYHVPYHKIVDLGYGDVEVWGLDCDGSNLDTNVYVTDTSTLLLKRTVDSTLG